MAHRTRHSAEGTYSEGVSNVFDASLLSERLDSVIEAVARPGGSALLLGEPGAGKSRLAEAAAYLLEAEYDERFSVTIMSTPPGPTSGLVAVFGLYFPEILEPLPGAEPGDLSMPPAPLLASRLRDAIFARAAGKTPLLVVSDVHEYGPMPAFLLEQLVRLREVHIIATAQRLTGAADRVSRDPRVRRITVGPLTIAEADRYLGRVLGVAHIASPTLHRWHAATGGNIYALGLLALSCDRRGIVRRNGGLASVPPGLDDAPEEFAHFAVETCTPDEMRTLELIAQAEPMIETELLALVPPAHASILMERGLIRVRRHPGGEMALRTAHPVFAASIREHMSPARRVEVCTELFEALDTGSDDALFMESPQQLTRLVTFGLESGRSVPHLWLRQAFTFVNSGASPKLLLRICLELMKSAELLEAAVVAVRAASFARLLGDSVAQQRVLDRIDDLVLADDAAGELPVTLRTRLQLLRIEQRFWAGARMEDVLDQLTHLEGALTADDCLAREMVRSSRFVLLAYTGRLKDAAASRPPEEPSPDINLEWVRAPARAIDALILQQRGMIDAAIRTAEDARTLAMLGSRPDTESLDLHGFCWFFGYWANGSPEAGRQALEEVEENPNPDVQAAVYLSGLVEAGAALLAAQEGRWRDAADQSWQLLEQLRLNDGYGLSPLQHAVHALALAAMGERERAIPAFRRALRDRRGVSFAIEGFRRRMLVRTRQWLRLGDPHAAALELAEWAREQEVQLVELEALHIAACESRATARAILPRARQLAGAVDLTISAVILDHIQKIVAGVPAADVEEPELRLLAELGLWLPLPVTGGLSAREREVALLASLGYSSRFIAERLHLSVRTVDTHLGHVYAKLGVEDRDGLRRWFMTDREFPTQHPGTASRADAADFQAGAD